jgi:hypothetical protein
MPPEAIRMNGPTRQFALNVVVPVIVDQEKALDELLRRIGTETREKMKGERKDGVLVDFEAVRSIHYARWVIMPGATGGKILAMNSWYDGPLGDGRCKESDARKRLLSELVSATRSGLDEVYRHCVGYPGSAASERDVIAFFERSSVPAAALYFGSPGRSREQVLREAELDAECRAWLDSQQPEGAGPPVDARQLRAAMKSSVDELGKFPAQEKDWGTLVGTTLLMLPLLLVAPVAAGALLVAETTDKELEPIFDEAERRHVRRTTAHEDEFFQNALSNVVEVKGGIFRNLLLRVVLFAINTLARAYFVDGKLGSIPSIHAAHWYLLDGGKRLAFVSNYDSSWESYLGDFIDQASSGLTAVWSNTKGYPRTLLLLFAGSRAGDRFKAWSHHIQVETLVWYAA